MDENTEPVEFDALLNHAGFLRGLARGLVGTAHEADDLVQRTWLRSLESPPRKKTGLKRWLGTVSGRLASGARRAEATRRRHELASAAMPESDKERNDEILQEVVSALRSLKEPFHSVVVMRFYEGLPPREIALRLQVPVRTVYDRLQRGLSSLREDLDRRYGGDRQRWGLALTGLVGLGEATLLGAGILRKSLLVRGLASLCVLLCVGLLWRFGFHSEPTADLETQDRTTSAGSVPRRPGRKPAHPGEGAGADSMESASTQVGKEESTVHEAVVVKGRLVDERRNPVGPALVTLQQPGMTPASISADESGRFAFTASPALAEGGEFGLTVATIDGRAQVTGFSRVRDTLEVSDLGALVCTKGSRARLALETDEPRQLMTRLRGLSLDGGVDSAFIGEPTRDEEGHIILPLLPAGDYLLRVFDGEGRQSSSRFSLPQTGDSLRVPPLVEGRSLLVLAVEAGNRTPVAGIRVRCSERVRSGTMLRPRPLDLVKPWRVTDERGRARFDGLPRGIEAAVFAFDDGRTSVGRRATGVVGDANEITLELPATRTAIWPIDPAHRPADPDGARLRVEPDPRRPGPLPPREARLSGENLVVEGLVTDCPGGWVRDSEDRMAVLVVADPDKEPAPLAFLPGRVVELRLRDANGDAVQGMDVEVRLQGAQAWLTRRASTDEEGQASLGGLPPAVVAVHIRSREGRMAAWQRVAEVDLRQEDAFLEPVLPITGRFEASVTVDGEPRLPTRFRFLVGNGFISSIEEFPQQAKLRFEARPRLDGVPISLFLEAAGLRGKESILRPDARGGVVSIRFDLLTVPTLRVALRAPPDGAYRLSVLRWFERGESWAAFGDVAWRVLADGRHELDGLPEGRYRVVDLLSGLAGDPVELRPGISVVHAPLDLHHTSWVEGRVRAPSNVEATVVEVDAGSDSDFKGETPPPVGVDGEVRIRVVAGHPVVLRPFHPLFVAADEGAGTRVRAGDDGFELRLEVRKLTTFELATPDATPPSEVWIYRGSPADSEPDEKRPIRPFGERLAFGGFATGPATLVFIWPDAAPLVLASRILLTSQDLGTLTRIKPSSLRLELSAPAGRAAPSAVVTIESLDLKGWWRRLMTQGRKSCLVEGLFAGRFTLTATRQRGAVSRIDVERRFDLTEAEEKRLALEIR